MQLAHFTERQRQHVDVVLALCNDLLRFGVEHLLHQLDVRGPALRRGSLAEAAREIRDTGATRLLIGAMNEVDEPALAEIRHAAARGVYVLLLVDADRLGSQSELDALLDLSSVGFIDISELSEESLSAALNAASKNRDMPIPPSLARALLLMRRNAGGESRRARLTPRELHTLGLMTEGLSNRQIGRRLGISEHGAKRHVANVLGKLNCANRTQAVAIALRDGLCEPRNGPRAILTELTG